MKTNHGFTLIELLVVISVISMLASVVLAALSPARAQARDARRLQDIHQIDLAVQQYILDNEHPPEWDGCETQSVTLNSGTVSGCVAVSTSALSGTGSTAAWTTFTSAISKYMPTVPNDLCTSGTCIAANGTRLGYTYIPPVAMKYYCANGSSCGSGYSASSSYQITAGLEGGGTSGGNTGNSIVTTPVVTMIVNGSPRPANHDFTVNGSDNIQLGWVGTGFGSTYMYEQKCGLSSLNGYGFGEVILYNYDYHNNMFFTLFNSAVKEPFPRKIGVSCVYQGKTYTDYVNLYR
ncbi:MAG: type II secretion system protein [Candidatus Taylorbacteria bacterium]